ncbi:imelysin family protein [Sulfitobacter mediterraneus]|uniref:imelysin family protein n=1 Tax=Sulfitobacter mediterraneus TaxID=83219 RepID=UPI0019338183|nr:imelysin family protein [Sulfitobacter mediterraneus]MBM1311360.1 imelysin family protein [Sulfitobacter mediterraneus]MBM1315242.1 imelysin family protein [Sulfitobacter mediterraneus]MBM1323603.1 imelysin family protein [Sulfitobacter mediterraneus]MBM1327515.1 imelysin family protein [Sulfitobacter mediterraneus]MBM1398863.1 imelysin family protein [Sulfitobacter mediterraneus]
MRRTLFAAAIMFAPLAAAANPSISDIIDDHILPRFETLVSASEALSDAAMQDCDPFSDNLRNAYGTAFDAWVSASHLRFGPTEVDDRAFALAFWPDSRGATPRALNALIAAQDPIGFDLKDYNEVSIAARGFYALEFLLYDDDLINAGNTAYNCALIQTVTADIAATASAIQDDWKTNQADVLLSPGRDAAYRSDEEVLQEMLRALSAGLQFTQDSRLGRPLGTFDRPRPKRAEARRSGRSVHHVILSLMSLQDLASHLAVSDAALSETLDRQIQDALSKLGNLNDPVFAGVADPQSRLKIEVISQAVGTIHSTVQTKLGPTLGVAAGFNSLDGD